MGLYTPEAVWIIFLNAEKVRVNMAMQKKCVAIIIIVASVIILSAYFIFSPGNFDVDKTAEAREMSDSIQLYNEKYNIYSAAYTDVINYGSQMASDSKITTNELFTYESKLTEYINASEDMFAQSQVTKELVKSNSDRFTETDYNRIISEFDNRITVIKTEINNIIELVSGVRSNITQTPEHSPVLQSLSMELLDMANS